MNPPAGRSITTGGRTRVVVVGGGVMGSAAAWRLAARGLSVTLLERYGPGHTNGSSHGSSRIFRLAYLDPYYMNLAARALPLWRSLEEEAQRRVLTLTGMVDHGPHATVERIHQLLRGAGHAAQLVDPEDAASRWPGLRFDRRVVFHPTAGRVHADDAVAAFQAAAAARGAEIVHDSPVDAVRLAGSRVEVIARGAAARLADAVVVAVGGWAPVLATPLVTGMPPLFVTLEQPVHFPAPDALSWPSFLHHGQIAQSRRPPADVYGLGSVDGVKVGFHAVGPPIDPEHGSRAVDPAALRRVQEYAAAWLPGVDHTRPAGSTCIYTLTPDHDFVVDRTGPVTVLAGFSGHGFKFAPAIGELAAELVCGGAPADRFALGRLPGPAATPGR